jgi:hypothetical protein
VTRPPVNVALALARGVARGDTGADDLLVAGFNSVEEAAQAHAYLAGFLLQLLAAARAEEVTATVEYVQAKLTA